LLLILIATVVAICPNKSNKTINQIATDATWVLELTQPKESNIRFRNVIILMIYFLNKQKEERKC